MVEKDVKTVLERLDSLKKIVIVSHTNPDGDAIGAALGLYHYLQKKGFNCTVVVPNELPGFLQWMSASDEIMLYSTRKDECDSIILTADAIFCVDFNGPTRVDKMKDVLLESKAFKVLIDHHLFPDMFCDITISNTQISSTSELIYNFIMLAGDESKLDKTIADCLYVGIVTDTGSFSYSCNYEATYLVIAHLYRLGIDGADIHHKVYDTYSEGRLRLLGYCLSDRLKVMQNCGTAYMFLTKEDLLKFDYQTGDTEGVVNYALSIAGINFAALFTERQEKIRISFRSKGDFSVNEFSKKYFNGGGHRNAAGGDSFISMQETITRFETIVEENKLSIVGE